MYTQKSNLRDEFSVVDSVLLVKKEGKSRKVLVPDNMAEIYISISGRSQVKPFDSVRHVVLNEEKCCFMMPRRRGIELLLDEGAECLVIKISPLFARKISIGLESITTGIFSVTLSNAIKSDVRDSQIHNDLNAINELVSESLFEEIGIYKYNEVILDSIEQIRQSNGNVSVKELYTNLEVSKSKLEQHFNRELGLSPKEFCKIEKINCFIKFYLEGKGRSLTELTYLCGYYDQSHLIKDFKYFLNTSPSKFFKT